MSGRMGQRADQSGTESRGMLSMDLGVFSGMDFLEQVEGRKERVRRTTYLSPLAAPSMASPGVYPSTCLAFVVNKL